MSEPILCTYIDLDHLIERCGLSPWQREIVRRLMDGYTMLDIAKLTDRALTTIDVQYRRAVEKIVRCNNEDWRQAMERKVS